MYSRNKLALICFIIFSLALVVACNTTPTSPAPSATKAGGAPGGAPQGKPGGAQTTPIPVTPTPITSVRVVVSKVKVAGTIVAASQASLTFAASGRLKELPVAEGSRVPAGTLLATLDTAVLEAQLAQAKAALDLATANWNRIQAGPTNDEIALARSTLERAKAAVDQTQAAYDAIGGQRNARIQMMPQGAALQQATLAYQIAVAQYNQTVNRPTDAEREIGLAQFAQAQAAYDTAKHNVNNARIVAPFDGTLVSITPKVGESIGANSPVMVFADLAQMQVLANIDETTLANVQIGQTTTIYVDALPNQVLTGRVKRIGLFATTTGNVVTVPVWIEIAKTSAPIFPGWSATVEIVTRQ
ncbi:MAG: HlyD family efflux transporter periplasmic adaptor subunit [Anaerolineales bacterium]|nr:HlyD family efflux transporter periplasmic adaptor subunit [Anaerolineales bacterium]